MPYALFCNDAKLSNAYPTEADVWKLARKSGLVVDVVSGDTKPAPRPVLDMTTKSDLAGRTPRKIRPRIRRMPSARPRTNYSGVFEYRVTLQACAPD